MGSAAQLRVPMTDPWGIFAHGWRSTRLKTPNWAP
jgi:hypothetical protein